MTLKVARGLFTTKAAKSTKVRINLTAKNAKCEKDFFVTFVRFVVKITARPT
jgi:hypothetical protein